MAPSHLQTPQNGEDRRRFIPLERKGCPADRVAGPLIRVLIVVRSN